MNGRKSAILGTPFADRLEGSGLGETLIGFRGADTIVAGGGDDVVIGGRGPDSILAGSGDDKVIGGRGPDHIRLGAGDDRAHAGRGDDTIATGAGNDRVDGGKGFDVVTYAGSVTDAAITALPGNRTEVATASGVDTLRNVEALYFAEDDYFYFLDGTNNDPLARDDAFATGENDPLELTAAALLANDLEFDGEALTLVAVDGTSAAGAVVTLEGGVIRYDPGSLFDGLQAGQSASDSFSYTVADGRGGSDTATVTITILGENDAPKITAEMAVTIDENTTDVPAAVSTTDPDSAVVSFSLAGVDAAFFTIDPVTGALAFAMAPDFEAPKDAGGDNVYEVTVIAIDAEGASDSVDIAVTVADVTELPQVTARINEIHYDNAGADQGEFVEIRTAAGDDVSFLVVELVNGNGGAVYNSVAVAGLPRTTDGTWDYYVWALPSNGIQNGAPDGVVLANGPEVIEFLSYEGSFEATGGVAAGLLSTDVGVFEAGDTPIGLSLQREADGSWSAPRAETPGAENIAPPARIVITEIMQNPSAVADSAGEWFEVFNAGDGVVDLNGWTIRDNDFDSHVIDNGGPLLIAPGSYLVLGNNADAATNGGVAVAYQYAGLFLSNGADELLLIDPAGREIDRVEYDGGPLFPDPNGASMALIDPALDNNVGANWTASALPFGDGDLGTPGAANAAPPVAFDGRINEFHYDNAGSDVGEFVEIRVSAGADVSAATVVLYNGNGGAVYGETGLSGLARTSDGTWDYYVWEVPGIQNGAPDGIALANAGVLVEFLSYEGSFVAVNGPAAGVASTDIGVSEAGDTPVGQSLQRNDDGSWRAPEADTRGAANDGVAPPPPPPPLDLKISEVQGTGFASFYEGMVVRVEAVVTYTVEGQGFFLQEEDADADGDARTSEGIFVFTGGGTLPGLGDTLSVTGTVREFFGMTQIDAVSDVTVLSGGAAMPTPADLLLGPDSTAADKEAVEGMSIRLLSATADPITVITNFNLDRFGEIFVSAGVQYQPTQLFDAQTEAAQVAALAEANLNNRLKIDDGRPVSNPTEFAYIPATVGDNGNGFLDAGDSFGAAGPTLRLGAELQSAPTGVMTYAFGAYTMLVNGLLDVDPTTNEGARQASPDDVGGSLQLAAFNVLNYFTTLGSRGATTPEDFARQEVKIVEAMAVSGVDVFALQEIENNGFGAGSASATLAAALSARTGESFAVVDATGGAPLGSDAITTSILYDSAKVTLVESATLVFEEASAAVTLGLAQDLAGLIGAGGIDDFQRNRPAVVATFEDNASGASFTVASVHFKSKGDSGLARLASDAEAFVAANPARTDVAYALAALRADANFDQGDGQGFWNGVRSDAAAELYSFLSGVYGGGGVSDYIVLGDFNAYTREDPTQAFTDQADTVDLLAQFVGEEAYSFVFDGQRGALDQVIASAGLADNVTGLAEWHINADEPDLLSYSSRFNDARFYSPDVFAASDHDPVILGLDFTLDLV